MLGLSFNLVKHVNKYLIAAVLLIGFFQVSHATISNLDETATLDQLKNMVLIDASDLSKCQKESVKTATCIPANTFQSEQGELASFYHITWVFGTAGIQGSEELLVFADNENQRDAVLGLLYLAGQKKSWRWNAKKTDLLKLLGSAKGQTRSVIRSKYYTVKMRDKYLVLASELESLKQLGWQLSAASKLINKQTIVTGKLPLQALARFTQFYTLKTKDQMLKILINSPIKQPSAASTPS